MYHVINSPLQIIQLIHQLLMLLLRILHRIIPLDVFLRLFVNIMQLFVADQRVLGGHLEDDRYLGIGKDLDVFAGETGAEG